MSVNKDLNEVQVSLMALLLPLALMGCESQLLSNGNEKSITFIIIRYCVRGTKADPTPLILCFSTSLRFIFHL